MSQEEELIELSQVCAALKEEVIDLRQLVAYAAYILREVPENTRTDAIYRSWLNLRDAWLQRARELGITAQEQSNGAEDNCNRS